MTQQDLKARLVVDAEVNGKGEFGALSDEVKDLAKSTGLAGPELAELADELNKLGSQQLAIAQFEQLKAATAEAAAKAKQFQQATREAAQAIREKQAALATAVQAEKAAADQLDQARAAQGALGATIKELSNELKAMAKAAKATGDSSAILNEKLADGRAQLGVLRAEYKAVSAGVAELAKAQRASAAAVTGAQQATNAAQKEFERFRTSAGLAKQAVAEHSQELQRSRDELTKLGISSSQLAQAQVGLNRGLANSRASLAALAAEAEAAAAVLANRELLGVRAHADVQREIDKTRQAYEALKASGKLTSVELAQAAMKTEERVRELKAQTNGWAESLMNAKGAFAGLAASGAGLTVAVNSAIKFESAMADVAKVVDGTDEQMAALTKRIKDMTATIPLAATELAQIAAAGGQLGVPIERMGEFIELAAQMATAFNMSADQAGLAVAKLSNVFAMPMEKVRALGDAINVLGNSSAATEAGIVDVLTRIGGAARQFGLTGEQAAALAAAMLSLGASSEVAGTGINALLRKLLTANTQAPEFQVALSEMGISAKQLAKDIRDNPQRALSEFLNTLSKLDGAKQAEVLGKLFGEEYADDIARLLAGLDGYKKALASVGNAAATTGAMQEEFEKRVKTTASQIQILNNQVNVLSTNLGSVFLPLITPIISRLGDVAGAMASFAEEFPAISGLAATLVTLGASLGGMALAFTALRVAGAKSIGMITAGLPLLTKELALASTAAGNLKLVMGSLGAAAAAWTVGWDIGTYLRKEFLFVEEAGIKLAAGLTKAAARAQAAWEMLKAPFNDDTVEQAYDRLQVKLEQIDGEYKQLLDSAAKAHAAKQKEAAATDAAADATQKQADAQAKANAAAKTTTETTEALVAQFYALRKEAKGVEGAITELAAKLKFDDVSSVGNFVHALERLRAEGALSAREVGDAWKEALGKLSVTSIDQLRMALTLAKDKGIIGAEEWARANEQVLTASFDKLGVNAALALNTISDSAQDAITSVSMVADTAEAAGMKAEDAARAIEMAFLAAIPKADSLQAVNTLQLQLDALAESGKVSVEGVTRLQVALDKQRQTVEAQLPGIQSLDEALRSLGVNTAAALGQISEGAQQAISAVSEMANAAEQAGLKTEEAARAIEMAFLAAIPKADSLEAVKQLQQQMDELGRAGKISAAGMERLQVALDKQRVTIEEQIPGVQSLGEALKQLGVKPQKELEALAKSAKEAFDTVKASGTATPREINEAWKAMAEAAIEANNGVADGMLKAQAEAHGFTIKTDAAGKSIVESMKKAEDATRGVGDAAKGAAAAMDGMANAAWEAGGDLIEQARKHNAALGAVQASWLDAGAAASAYSDEMARLVFQATKNIESMRAEHAALVQQMEALARQQQRVEDANDGAARGVDDLRLRLLELTGTEEEIAQARHAREEAEIKRNRALIELDLQRAQIRGDADEVARLQQEIALLGEQLVLLDKIHAEEEKQRKAAARNKGPSGGSSSSSSSGAGGGVTTGGNTTTNHIVLNVHGVNDPVELARRIQPELKKLDRLAR